MVHGALYYPYIHMHDPNWLKATLLLFSEVERMLPGGGYTPFDDPEVSKFVDSSLLRGANLWSDRVTKAQELLVKRLKNDLENSTFRRRYGQLETRKKVAPSEFGFQIHLGKLFWELQDVLSHGPSQDRLAWEPVNVELGRDAWGYVELNPVIGEVVMSTLAVAAATSDGLDIVGDKRSGELHHCLIEKKANDIYDALLHPSNRLNEPPTATGEELFEFLLAFPSDVSALTPDKLITLRDDREALDKLIEILRDKASTIKLDPGKKRNQAFKDIGSDVLHAWREDRKNMSNYWREFFGEGLLDSSEKFLEAISEKLVKGGETSAEGATAAAAGAAVAGAGMAHVLTIAAAGAGAGLAIGVVFHGIKSFYRISQKDRDSPYRYLTIMEKAGVVFRSDLGVLKNQS